ncbi:PQQ-binding-like beta-propeller repeat protein [Flavobacterium sp. CBA20B-1]|uniref:outer membrane protein assembly factor BamB family protein n=1 Tax=unclassified Flavobacterium TaxID=196869 RepID=UPI0022241FAE|nr:MULTISPECIES: PQQ-binding-like beta-propeller repeat protein [unclassified Flavobacterium]WCM41055.1 PQQ-binding-like beta-propeller repeat protein [Flavobacterium sp. CBA20B-1]
MQRTISTFLFFMVVSCQLLAQAPNPAPQSDKNSYSNNQILTMEDMVFNNSIAQIKKIPLDTSSILIYDLDGTLISYNLSTEKINWKAQATDPDRTMSGNKLTLKDGIVYVPFINGEIYALNNQTGKAFWKTRLGNIKEGIIIKNQIPTIIDNQLYITTQNDNSNIYALDIKDGGLIWNYKLDYPYNHIPVLFFDNKVFTQSAPYFYSFDAQTGKALYKRGFKKAMYGKPVTDNKNIFISDESRTLYAMKPYNLDILWEYELPENQHNIKERIFCHTDNIYFGTKGSEKTAVYSLKTENGILNWKTEFNNDKIEYITENKGFLWGYTEKGVIFKLDLKTGKKIEEFQLTNIPVSNIEFKDENSLLYYCEAGLIEFDIPRKKEKSLYMRSSSDRGDAFIKLIR